MLRLCLLLVVLVPQLAVAQFQPFEARSGDRWAGNGPILGEPAGTLTHVWFDGANLIDSKAFGWVANGGGLPRRAAHTTPMSPARGNAGPGSASFRWASAAGADALDLANFEACFLFVPPAAGTLQYLYGNGNFSTLGYHVGINTNGTAFMQIVAGTVTTANAIRPRTLNAVCVGRSSTTASIMLNGGATATATVATTSDATRNATLGAGNAGTSPFLGYLVEALFSSTAYTDAWARSVWGTVTTVRTK